MNTFLPPSLSSIFLCLYLIPGQLACPEENDMVNVTPEMGTPTGLKKSHSQMTCSFFMSILIQQYQPTA